MNEHLKTRRTRSAQLRGWRAALGALWLCLIAFAPSCEGTKRAFGPGTDSNTTDTQEDVDPLQPTDGGDLEVVDAATPLSTDSGSSEQPPVVTPPAPGALGSACVIAEGCDSGFCVTGRCCESACDGLCEACSETGECTAVPADDSRCPVIDCGASSLCAEFPSQQEGDRCAALGVCKTECDPNYAAEGISCEPVAVDVAGLCDGSGICTDPRALQGQACDSTRDCRDMACVDGVCCAEACDGACESCNAEGVCVADPLGSGCGDGQQCFGRGQCLLPLGSACQGDDDCGSENCELAVGGGSACCAEPCPASFRCNGDGECVSPESDLGTTCTSGADCIGGRCFDGRCCDVACGGVCERCNAPGQEGRCVAAPVGSEETNCSGNRECAGRGQCRLGLGSACNLNSECRSGACEAALQGTGEICCEGPCPNGQRCGAGGNCVDAPDPDGSPCNNDGDCSSGECVAGRCCESACNGVCEACSSLGDCNVNPGNDTRCPVVDCPTSNTVCRTFPPDITTNLCGGFRTCRSAQTECQARFAAANTPCENVAPGVAGRCDGAGNCRDVRVGVGEACAVTADCAGEGAACIERHCCEFNCASAGRTCDANGRCVCPTGTTPAGNACRINDGQPCQLDSQCLSGQCNVWYADRDGDGHGNLGDSLEVCGAMPPAGFTASSDDCCDRGGAEAAVAGTIFPGQTRLFSTAQTVCADVRRFDYNCNGREEGNDVLASSCMTFPDCVSGWVTLPGCGLPGDHHICTSATMSCGPGCGMVTRCVAIGAAQVDPTRACN